MSARPSLPFRFGHLALASFFAAALSRTAAAQVRSVQSPETNYCLGFAFSPWTPALDLNAAGHVQVDTTRYPKGVGGRDWAVSGTKPEGDTTFMLFPMWWPAGVFVSLERTPRAPGDTVRGKAIALVANASTPPVSRLRAWEAPCGR